MSELPALLVALVARNWQMLDALLVVGGLVIYVTASHTLQQRRHPSAAIAWVMGILLVPYITLPLYFAFGSRKVVPSRPAAGARRRVAAATYGPAARAQQLGMAMGLPDPVA
jgi:cardiolipin synthase